MSGNGRPLTQLAREEVALELLPSSARLQSALKIAEESYRKASSKKAIAAARDLLEIAEQVGEQRGLAGFEMARGHLLLGIALRRSGKMDGAKKEYRACARILARLMEEEAEGSRRHQAGALRVELFLEEGISSFVKEDYLESARKNERAGSLAHSLGNPLLACRAWLNAAVSWDRCGEIVEVRHCLGVGESLLPNLPKSPAGSSLRSSFSLFSWRMGMDHGPLLPPPALDADATLSQKNLHSLYLWEYLLMTSDLNGAAQTRLELITRLKEVQETQFDAQIERLSQVATHFLEGGNPYLDFRSCVEAIRGGKPGPGFSLSSAAWLIELFLKGRWKKLADLSRFASLHPHPFVQAWGYRASAWAQARKGERSRALSLLHQAQALAQRSGMNHFLECLSYELDLLENGVERSVQGRSSQESRVARKFLEMVPARKPMLARVTLEGRSLVSEEEGRIEVEGAVTGTGAFSRSLMIDGRRNFLRIAGKTIQLDSMPMQRKLIFSIFAAYPKALSKDEIVSRVWDEVYNPLLHDRVIYRTVSRLRKLLREGKSSRSWVEFESGGLSLTPKERPFLALIPEELSAFRSFSLDERKLKILTLLKYRGRVTRSEAVQALRAPARTVARDLATLVERKLIVRDGAGRAASYLAAL